MTKRIPAIIPKIHHFTRMQLISPIVTAARRPLRGLTLLAVAALGFTSCKKSETIADTSAPPVLNIVSPVEGATIMPGGRLGNATTSDFNGTGFAINL